MSTAAVAPPSSTGQALAMLTTAMGYLADAGVTQLAAEVLAECLRVLERVDAVEIVARTRVLGAFAAAGGAAGGVEPAPERGVQRHDPGGETSTGNCILLCFFHHQVVIRRRGRTTVRHPDGTTMAWNRDKTKVLRSHRPPARAG